MIRIVRLSFTGSSAVPPLTCRLANLDEHTEAEDIDEETTGHLHREIEKAEADGHNQGKPGSFLNKLIMHGNKKTEEDIAKENARPK